MLGLTGLAIFGVSIPVLQQVAGFLFLTFVPGILLLRTIKVHNINVIESLLYIVGLSIAFAMAIGVILNFVLPLLGVLHPITVFPVITAVTIALLLLGIVAYKRDKTFIPARPMSEKGKGSAKVGLGIKISPILLAVLLPLLAILGTSLVNAYQKNILIMILIFIITIIIGLVAFNRFIPRQVYPFMIAAMAVSLLYQTTLISNYLVGSDIHEEYYLAKLVLESGYWSASIARTVNSCLSIVLLAPVYSLLLNMDIIWLFKIVYPLLFCLVPLALYRIFRLQIGSQYAFLATFFFIAMPMFFMDMTQLARQQISELFFALVILLMIDRRLAMVQRTILVIIFGLGVIVSHYGLGTGYTIGYITLGMLVLMLIKSRFGRNIWQRLIGSTNSLPDDLTSKGAFDRKAIAIIVGVSLIFMFTYYGAVASGTGLSGVRVATDIAQGTIQIDISAKEQLVRTAIGLDFLGASTGAKIWRILQYIVELCLIVGFLRLVFRPATLGKLKAEYISLTVVSAIILLGIFILPSNFQAYGMGVTRIWHVSLLITAPLLLFGGETIAYGIMKLGRLFRKNTVTSAVKNNSTVLLRSVVLIVLIPYFLFNSGLIFELSRSQTTNFINMPYSIVLSSHRLDLNTVFTAQDLIAATWLSNMAEEDEPVYVDHHSSRLFTNQIEFPIDAKELTHDTTSLDRPGYFYLRAWNTENEALTFTSGYGSRQSISFDKLSWFKEIMKTSDTIYSNGDAQVLIQSKIE
ncbi:MAG: DUF2206 domain-containing protein [Chloroflexota bacterium]|nr:MAG: DUF2206 domain-containing protein [Chloroflexota bacterium]